MNVRRCDCENSTCKVDHQAGGCQEPATVKAAHGSLCRQCATYMPEKYLEPRYTDEGLRVVLAEDWYIYVVRESDGLMFQYDTELWLEWGEVCERCYIQADGPCPQKHTVADLIPLAHDHTPRPLNSDSGTQLTIQEFNAEARP